MIAAGLKGIIDLSDAIAPKDQQYKEKA